MEYPNKEPLYEKPLDAHPNMRGKAITAMVFGICSVTFWFYPFLTSIPCIVFGILGISLGTSCIGYLSPNFDPMIKAARITGTIGLIISILYTLLFLILIFAAAYS